MMRAAIFHRRTWSEHTRVFSFLLFAAFTGCGVEGPATREAVGETEDHVALDTELADITFTVVNIVNSIPELSGGGNGEGPIPSCSEETTFRGNWSGEVVAANVDDTGEAIPPGAKIGWAKYGIVGAYYRVWASLQGTLECEELCRGSPIAKNSHPVAVTFSHKVGLGVGYKVNPLENVLMVFRGIHAGVKNAWFIGSHLGEWIKIGGTALQSKDAFLDAAGIALRVVLLYQLHHEKVTSAACAGADKTDELLFRIRQALNDL